MIQIILSPHCYINIQDSFKNIQPKSSDPATYLMKHNILFSSPTASYHQNNVLTKPLLLLFFNFTYTLTNRAMLSILRTENKLPSAQDTVSLGSTPYSSLQVRTQNKHTSTSEGQRIITIHSPLAYLTKTRTPYQIVPTNMTSEGIGGQSCKVSVLAVELSEDTTSLHQESHLNFMSHTICFSLYTTLLPSLCITSPVTNSCPETGRKNYVKTTYFIHFQDTSITIFKSGNSISSGTAHCNAYKEARDYRPSPLDQRHFPLCNIHGQQ